MRGDVMKFRAEFLRIMEVGKFIVTVYNRLVNIKLVDSVVRPRSAVHAPWVLAKSTTGFQLRTSAFHSRVGGQASS